MEEEIKGFTIGGFRFSLVLRLTAKYFEQEYYHSLRSKIIGLMVSHTWTGMTVWMIVIY